MKIAQSVIDAAIPRRVSVWRTHEGIYKILVPGHGWNDSHGVLIRQTTSGAIAAIKLFPMVRP